MHSSLRSRVLLLGISFSFGGSSALAGTSAAPQAGVDPVPVLVIQAEGATGALQLEAPLAATRTRDGRIVVAEVASLKVFSPNGTLLSKIGRAGDGPGEFRRLSWISSCGTDSVFAFDLAKGSIHSLGGNGSLAQSVDLRQALPKGTNGVTAVACSFAGARISVLTGPTGLAEVGPNLRRGNSQVLTSDRGSWRFSMSGAVPSQEFLIVRGGAAPRPLGRNTSVGYVGSELVVGTGDSGSVSIFQNGGRRSELRFPLEAARSTATMRERASDEFLELVPGPMRPQVRQSLEAISWPEMAPPYLRIVPSSTADLWLEVPSAIGGTTELVAVGQGGSIKTRVILPVRAHSVEVSARDVLVVTNDSDGVPSVRVYRRR